MNTYYTYIRVHATWLVYIGEQECVIQAQHPCRCIHLSHSQQNSDRLVEQVSPTPTWRSDGHVSWLVVPAAPTVDGPLHTGPGDSALSGDSVLLVSSVPHPALGERQTYRGEREWEEEGEQRDKKNIQHLSEEHLMYIIWPSAHHMQVYKNILIV